MLEVTTRGYIEVWRDGQQVSRHRIETEALESAIGHCEGSTDGTYELRFPRKDVLIQIAGRRAGASAAPSLYAGLTPTIYAAPTDQGTGDGSSEANAMDLPAALSSATAGAIIGLLPGVYTKSPAASPSTFTPAWRPTNSGSSGSPIRVVAKYPAVTYPSQSANWSELRNGVTSAWSGCPTFGAQSRSYVEWLGIYVNEVNSYTSGDGGMASLNDADHCAIKYCRLIGAGDHTVDNLHNGIRVDTSRNGGHHTVSHNLVSNVNPGTAGANEAGIMVLAAGTITVEHNEVYDCASGIFVKRNGAVPGTITFRYNHVHDTGGPGIRIGTHNANGSTANFAYVYQNLVLDCGGGGLATDSSSEATGDNVNTYFQNNTVVGCGYGYANTTPLSGMAAFKLWNNIVVSPAASGMYFEGWTNANVAALAEANLDAEHNVYRSVTTFFTSDVASTRDLTYWQGTIGQDSASPAAITSDPLFVGGGSYKLQGSSPALTHGRDLLNLSGGGVGATIPAGCYITGSETIGTGY